MSEFSAKPEARKPPAALMIPAHDGEATLVPPTIYHPTPKTGFESYTHTPEFGLESKDTSGVPRELPTMKRTKSWNFGRGSTVLRPPPVSCHVLSRMKRPLLASREIVVPPADT